MKKKIIQLLRQQIDYVSGEALSQTLGVSRAAVNKQIMSLRGLGYEIESATNRGYRLVSGEQLNQIELELLVEKHQLPIAATFYDTIDSTNRVGKVTEQPSLIVAFEQTQGRGRRGRDWISAKGQGLYFSLVLKPELAPECISSITQLVGLCLARSLSSEAMIKWPNDIFLGGKKLAGILSELVTQADYVEKLIIGIGVNFAPVSDMKTATSLAEQRSDLSMIQLLERFLVEFFANYPVFLESQNLAPWLEEINQRSFLQGKTVEVVGQNQSGVFVGIDQTGQAIVEGDERLVLSYGEVSLRGWQ